MSRRKNLEDLRADLLALQSEIKKREDGLKLSLGEAVISQTHVNSISEFMDNYQIVKKEPKQKEKNNV